MKFTDDEVISVVVQPVEKEKYHAAASMLWMKIQSGTLEVHTR